MPADVSVDVYRLMVSRVWTGVDLSYCSGWYWISVSTTILKLVVFSDTVLAFCHSLRFYVSGNDILSFTSYRCFTV